MCSVFELFKKEKQDGQLLVSGIASVQMYAHIYTYVDNYMHTLFCIVYTYTSILYIEQSKHAPAVVVPAPKRSLSPHAGSRAMREMCARGHHALSNQIEQRPSNPFFLGTRINQTNKNQNKQTIYKIQITPHLF